MRRPSYYGYRTVRRREYPTLSKEQIKSAKRYGKAHGYAGEAGGWIYNKDGQHVAHGWAQFYVVIGGMVIDKWIRENRL